MRLAIAGLALLLWVQAGAAPAPREERLTALKSGLSSSLKELDKNLQAAGDSPSKAIDVRDVSNGALALLLLNQDAPKAEAWMRRVLAAQNMEASAAEFGALPWQVGPASIHDENSIEFGTAAWGPMLLEYGERLSPEFKKDLQAHARAAVHALLRHTSKESPKQAPVSYTNIYLMNTVNLLLIGQALNDKKVQAEGSRQLDQWLEYTRAAGIHEFDSPTYYGPDLNSLMVGYRLVKDPTVKARLKWALDYFWSDIAANAFAGLISGPHSRDYDFLKGQGGALFFLYLEGLRQAQSVHKLDFEKTLTIEGESGEGAYHPSAEILSLANQKERWIRSRWGEGPNDDRFNFITEGVSLGAASGNYSPQDKMLTADFVSSDKETGMVGVSLVPDVTGQPYGKNKVVGRDGHNKARHVPLNLIAVQERGVLLALLDLNPSKELGANGFSTNVLLPARADSIRFNGHDVRVDKPMSKDGKLGSTLVIGHGKGCLGVRVLHADGIDGATPNIRLVSDETSLQNEAARLQIQQAPDTQAAFSDRHTRVALLFVASTCLGEGELKRLEQQVSAASFAESVEKKGDKRELWRTSVTLGKTKLEAEYDLTSRSVLARKANGQPIAVGHLEVNGVDLGLRLPGAAAP